MEYRKKELEEIGKVFCKKYDLKFIYCDNYNIGYETKKKTLIKKKLGRNSRNIKKERKMIIDRYIDLLKIIDNKKIKEISITNELYQFLKHDVGFKDLNNLFFGIKINVIKNKKSEVILWKY